MGRSNSSMDIGRIRRLLRETTRLAKDASLTGSLEGGCRIAIRQYNSIRNHLQEIGAIPEELFQELDEDDSNFDELGVVCGMLDGYLEEDESSESDHKERSRHGRDRHRVVMGLGDLGDLSDLGDLRDLGDLIRENMPHLLRERRKYRENEMETPRQENVEERGEREIRHTDKSAEIQQIALELQREDLDYHERIELAQRLAQLCAAR